MSEPINQDFACATDCGTGIDESVRPRSLDDFIGQDELRANLQAMAAQVDGLANQLKLLAAGANSLCNSSMQAPPPNNRRQGLHTPCVGEIR